MNCRSATGLGTNNQPRARYIKVVSPSRRWITELAVRVPASGLDKALVKMQRQLSVSVVALDHKAPLPFFRT